ncbi:MAG: DUF2336 domain-containing protein, partial [Pseudomonadota bacterium]
LVSLNLLNSAPEAQSLLVSLYDKHKLYSMSGEHEPEAQSELATIMADILNVDLGPLEQEIIADVLMSLVAQAEKNLRKAIAHKMSVLDNAPLRLILNLANDDIDIATPILKHSPVLNDTDLLYIVNVQNKEYWQVIAERAQLSQTVINTLANTRDVMTAQTLIENKNIKLSEHALRVFSVMAQTHEPMTKPLIERPEMTGNLVKEIYDFVGHELKKYIDENFDLNVVENFDIALQETKDEIVSGLDSEFAVTTSMIEEAETLCRNDMLSTYEMINYLKRGQIATFIACFSVYCGIPVDTAEKMLRQKHGQGLAIACKALKVMKTDFINMYLLTSRLRDEQMVEHRQLNKAINYFEKINVKDAEEILLMSRH